MQLHRLLVLLLATASLVLSATADAAPPRHPAKNRAKPAVATHAKRSSTKHAAAKPAHEPAHDDAPPAEVAPPRADPPEAHRPAEQATDNETPPARK
jgi:hypothetical protein